jgi:hypothetical protein
MTAVPLNLSNDLLDLKSSLRAPHDGGLTPKSSVRFDGTPRSLLAESVQGSAAPSKRTSAPLTAPAPTIGTIATQINAIHDMIMASDLAPLKKKTCHIALFDADRLLVAHYAAKDKARDSARRQREEVLKSGPSQLTSKNVAAASVQSAHVDPAAQFDATPRSGTDAASLSEGGLTRRAARKARAEASWQRFLSCVSGHLSPAEVELLSLATIKRLTNHYGIDRDAVDVANIELHWRQIAQDREDLRNQKAIINKQCAAAPEPQKKKAARDLSASFNKRSDQRR